MDSTLREQVDQVPSWWHSIDLGQGIITRGHKSHDYLQGELKALRLPDLRNKTVLDIGAWDGFYSFEAERQGARRVVALDHFVWSMHWPSLQRHQAKHSSRSMAPHELQRLPEVWRPTELPGQAGFNVAHRARSSRVEAVVADFMSADLDALGTFDVVLYLGVLYHMENPLLALRRLAQVTREVAIIESHAVHVPGREDRSLCEFFEADDCEGDGTNWWAPNLRALFGLCRAAGFRHVDKIQGPGLRTGSDLSFYRAIVHAWK
jgi:tRNA (mo5U34)-methyltransferase